jgi:[ribosomal protein S18]-alanine N-acetyltransferase
MIAQYEIALAAPSDAMAIADLSRDAIEYGLAWRWTARRVARSVRDSETNVVVAREGGRFMGFAIMKYQEEEAHLLLLAVQAAQRRRGVASALLDWLESTVRAAGMTTIRLETRAGNAAALSFYERHGFREVGRQAGYYDGVEDALGMVKDLSVARTDR